MRLSLLLLMALLLVSCAAPASPQLEMSLAVQDDPQRFALHRILNRKPLTAREEVVRCDMEKPKSKLKEYIVLITGTPRIALATDGMGGYSIAKENESKTYWAIVDKAPSKEKALEIIDQLTKTSN